MIKRVYKFMFRRRYAPLVIYTIGVEARNSIEAEEMLQAMIPDCEILDVEIPGA